MYKRQLCALGASFSTSAYELNPEVKDAAFTFRARVDFYIVGFDGYASLDDFRKDAEDVHVRACFFEEFEEFLVSDAAQFHSFAKSVVEVAAREGFRHGGVDVDGSRPVSYTHLDVYKRQSLPFSRAETRPGEPPLGLGSKGACNTP